jgi:hypothetical protein
VLAVTQDLDRHGVPGENWASVASSGCSSMTLPSMLTMMSPSLTPPGRRACRFDAGHRVAIRIEATDQRPDVDGELPGLGDLPG